MRSNTRWLFAVFFASSALDSTLAIEARGQNGKNATSQVTIPPTGSGNEYASQCNAAKQTWSQSGGMSISTATSSTVYTTTILTTSWTTSTFLSSDPGPYTLCDGYPRMNGSRTVIETEVPGTFTTTSEVDTTITSLLPQPKCLINPNDCSRLHDSYTKAQTSYEAYTSTQDPNAGGDPSTSPLPPICGPLSSPKPMSTAVGEGLCFMKDASVQLLYWPVTTAASCDACHRRECPTTTLGPTISGKPNTFKTLGTTLTSPTVYVEFMGSWAFTTEGRTFTSAQKVLIPQSSDQVSSYCGKLGGGYGTAEAVNYANFNRPVPADVYRCQPSCFQNPRPYPSSNVTMTNTYNFGSANSLMTATMTTELTYARENQCSTIWDDYRPVLSIPEAFKTIQPSGYVKFLGQDSLCMFTFDEDSVLFDPPLALTEAASIVKPTAPPGYGPETHAPATPAGQPTLPAGRPTDRPEATALPQDLPTTPGGPTLPNDPTQATPPPSPNDPPNNDPNASPNGNQAPHIGDIIASGLGMGPHGDNDHTEDHITLSLADDGSSLMINGWSTPLAGQKPDQAAPTTGDGTIMGVSYSHQGTDIVLGGQTLSPGKAVIVTGDSSGASTTATEAATTSNDEDRSSRTSSPTSGHSTGSSTASPASTTSSGASSTLDSPLRYQGLIAGLFAILLYM